MIVRRPQATTLPPARYLSAALGLKLFSVNAASRGLYREIANRIGGKRRLRLAPEYIERGNWLVREIHRLAGREGKSGAKFLELGTGWMHFYSLYLKFFFEFHGTMFDVWDNRQLVALKRIFLEVAAALSQGELPAQPRSTIAEVSARIAQARDCGELYSQMGLDYVMNPGGSLDALPADAFDVVFSMDVLEHVRADSLAASIQEYFRVLKPGGHSLHQIGVDDHLTHYCPSASPKQYLAYSDFWWQVLFENGVQYFNRVSYDGFMDLFAAAGFELVDAHAQRDPSSLLALEISPQYRMQSAQSLEATRVYVIHRKPR